MGDYVIRKGNKSYAIVEIEFYFYSPNHRDFITYPRNTESGMWYFHNSGVDLTFKSQGVESPNKDNKKTYNAQNATFGGILIRGLYDLDNNNTENPEHRYIFGPQKCVNLLWDRVNAFQSPNDEYPVLVKDSGRLNLTNLVRCKRCINIKAENQHDKVQEWAKRIGIKRNEFEPEKTAYCNELFNPENDKYSYRFFNLITGHNPITFTRIQPAASRPTSTIAAKM